MAGNQARLKVFGKVDNTQRFQCRDRPGQRGAPGSAFGLAWRSAPIISACTSPRGCAQIVSWLTRWLGPSGYMSRSLAAICSGDQYQWIKRLRTQS
jgi:hypothetical protein